MICKICNQIRTLQAENPSPMVTSSFSISCIVPLERQKLFQSENDILITCSGSTRSPTTTFVFNLHSPIINLEPQATPHFISCIGATHLVLTPPSFNTGQGRQIYFFSLFDQPIIFFLYFDNYKTNMWTLNFQSHQPTYLSMDYHPKQK